MEHGTNNRFTFKIIASYLVLVLLAVTAGYFIYAEVKGLLYPDMEDGTDRKLLKTGALVAKVYEAESLSKLALQSGTQENFDTYAAAVDTLILKIDTLKQLSASYQQVDLLDSVQVLLKQKVANSSELRALRAKSGNSKSIDRVLKEFRKMESAFGKLTIHNFEPHPEKLTPYKRKVLEDWVAYLNENIPEEDKSVESTKKIDSILNASTALLAQAKKNDSRAQRFLAQKERQINANDLELSQQLQTIISAIEQEIILKSYAQNTARKAVLRKSIRLAAGAALLGFLAVALFAFLINRDFWRIQTYRQRLEREKKFSESVLKSREQLISTVSHDLRTPLHTITGYTELMEGTPLNDRQQQYLKSIKSASGYVGNLVNDLLDFSKLEAGKLQVEKIPFVLANLIKETAEHIQALNRDKSIQLSLEIDPRLQVPLLGDPFRVRQIVTNLIGNAYKFTEEGSVRVTAKATEKGKSISTQIAVIDTGIGIPKAKQKLIFREFSQADTTTEKKFGGYGLGLTISKKLTKLLGGELRVESKEGKGSTFLLQLPFQICTPQVAPVEKGQYMKRKLRILIIDDDTALLRMLRELTAPMGITTHIFSNFLQVEKNGHLDYDLVLTDIQMPQITGFEVLKQLKSGAYDHYSDQPIVAITGRRDLQMDAYGKLGFAQVLQKPFSKNELMAVLKLLGFETEVAAVAAETSIPHTDVSRSYDLETIRSFLGDNEDAINDVLRTFVEDTRHNMATLRKAMAAGDSAQINGTAHRMLPMFRQLNVPCTPILEVLETGGPETLNKEELATYSRNLDATVSELLSALKKRLATNPTYSD